MTPKWGHSEVITAKSEQLRILSSGKWRRVRQKRLREQPEVAHTLVVTSFVYSLAGRELTALEEGLPHQA